MIAYVHLSADGSGCFKARTNDSVGWVVTNPPPPPPEEGDVPSFRFEPSCGKHFYRAVLQCNVVLGWHPTVTLRWINISVNISVLP